MKLKRIICSLLLLAMLVSILPATYADAADSAASSTKVYYPIDLSAAVARSTILQQVKSDCAIVSMATVEAYLHGVTTDAEKKLVYQAVCQANNHPGNNYAYWGNVGYVAADLDWNVIYEKLEAGYPTLIHRPASEKKSQHWCAVAGYTGSSTTLEPDKFLVVDVYANNGAIGMADGTNILTVADWRGSAVIDRMVYRKNGIAITNLSDGIRMAVNVPKAVHHLGMGHSVCGTVVSNATLTDVQIRIMNASNGQLFYDQTVHPYANSYQVSWQDSHIRFSYLSAGEYYYTIFAMDDMGNSGTLVKYFIVDSKWPDTLPEEPVYTIQYDGNGGTGSADSVTLKFLNGNFTLPENPYMRPGYKFLGWSVQRTPDQRWYGSEDSGWLTESEMTAQGYNAQIFEAGCITGIDHGWIENCGHLSPTFTFYARWEPLCANVHDFQDGICSICGAEDPNYAGPTESTVPDTTEPEATEPEATAPEVTEPETQGVTRVFGADRYATAFKAADTLKAQLGVSKFQNIVVAPGTDFPDALAGSYLAAVKNAPILLVRGANVNDVKNYIKANLAPGGTVYLLGGVNVVPKTMETGLDGFNVKRLGGDNRYDTNLLILQEAGVGDKDIIVCTGLNFADSLSASATGLPILLVKDGLYANQKEFLKSNGGDFIVVGGTNAVNSTIEKQLKTYGNVKRLAGNTRYDTSVLVAKEFFNSPKSAVLAYAQNFPDGLSGGPLAYALKAPLILTDNNKPTAAVNYANGIGIKSGYVLGGTGLISDKVAKNIFSMASDSQILVK